MIEVSGLCKHYGELVAVRDLSFRVRSGEVVGFLGVNGAGKTTTMRMITGFLPPTSGTVTVAGCDLEREPEAARRAIGYLPEQPPLYPEMRVCEYLRFAASIQDVARAERSASVGRAIRQCGLESVANKVIRTLSRGYRQRVGLAQAVVHEPEVLILDEPTAGLDPIQIREIRELIVRLAAEQGRTVLLSTHILPEVEAICQRVLVLGAGALRLDGTLEQVREQGTLEEVFLRESLSPSDAPLVATGPEASA